MEKFSEKKYLFNEEEWRGWCPECGDRVSEEGVNVGGTCTTYDMAHDCHSCGAICYVSYSKSNR